MTGMVTPRLDRITSHGVTLLGDLERPSGVTLAFTERTGGVSEGPYSSLNMGILCGDDATCVSENRRRAFVAMGLSDVEDRLVTPTQVHGDTVVVVADDSSESLSRAREQALEGADAVVCTVPDVPVLLCFADCVPIVLVASGGFAVVHSGWAGTKLRIAAKAARILCDATDTNPSDVNAYIGPHIAGEDYVVSSDLCDAFAWAFGEGVCLPGNKLDLGACVRIALGEAGVADDRIVECDASTASAQDRFFSYRASGGSCGRHSAIACMTTSQDGEGR